MMRFPQQPLMQPPVPMPPLAMVTSRPPLMPMPPPVMMHPTSKLERHVPLPRDLSCYSRFSSSRLVGMPPMPVLPRVSLFLTSEQLD